jgi:tetratricopeptide (TPR) repeat protein
MSTIAERFADAVRRHAAGRRDEAETLYRGVLQEAPDHPHALHLLGVLVHQAGRHAEAADLIRRALAAHGPHPAFHSNLAAVCLALGLLGDAEAHSREALRLNPNLVDARNNLGVALRRQGRLDEASTALHEALRLQPRHVDARCNLAAVLHGQGLLAEPLALLQEAVRLAPDHAQTRSDLGGLLLACGEPEQALPQLREAVRLQPTLADAHANLGQALRRLDQVDEATLCFREALRLNPDCTVARGGLAYVLEGQGRIDEALAEHREALRRDPGDSLALAGLGQLAQAGRYCFDDEEVRRLRALAERPQTPLDDRIRLQFTLARALDQAGADDEAFAHYRQGNELRRELERRRGVVFDPDAHRRFIDRLIGVCSPDYLARVHSFGLGDELPVFIVGMPRSGTTLAEQILASHPRVHGAGELPDLIRLAAALPRRLGGAEEYPECLARLDSATTRTLAAEHLQRLRGLGGDADRVVDKMPYNYLHLGLIGALFPRARIVHCRRDPVDTCLSCYFQNFGDALPFTRDLRHLGLYYREYERLMAHWAGASPVPLFELRYEELTAHQEAVSRALVAFCGLEWDERCLRFHEARTVVRTASVAQVRQPMYRRSVGRWRRYRGHLQPLLEALGV